MNNLQRIKNEGIKYIKPELAEEWYRYCESLYYKEGLRDVSIGIIEDAIETMKLLNETDMSADEIVKKVGRNWDSRISSTILLTTIEKFSLEWKRFKEGLTEYRSRKSTKTIDDVFGNKR